MGRRWKTGPRSLSKSDQTRHEARQSLGYSMTDKCQQVEGASLSRGNPGRGNPDVAAFIDAHPDFTDRLRHQLII